MKKLSFALPVFALLLVSACGSTQTEDKAQLSVDERSETTTGDDETTGTAVLL